MSIAGLLLAVDNTAADKKYEQCQPSHQVTKPRLSLHFALPVGAALSAGAAVLFMARKRASNSDAVMLPDCIKASRAMRTSSVIFSP